MQRKEQEELMSKKGSDGIRAVSRGKGRPSSTDRQRRVSIATIAPTIVKPIRNSRRGRDDDDDVEVVVVVEDERNSNIVNSDVIDVDSERLDRRAAFKVFHPHENNIPANNICSSNSSYDGKHGGGGDGIVLYNGDSSSSSSSVDNHEDRRRKICSGSSNHVRRPLNLVDLSNRVDESSSVVAAAVAVAIRHESIIPRRKESILNNNHSSSGTNSSTTTAVKQQSQSHIAGNPTTTATAQDFTSINVATTASINTRPVSINTRPVSAATTAVDKDYTSHLLFESKCPLRCVSLLQSIRNDDEDDDHYLHAHHHNVNDNNDGVRSGTGAIDDDNHDVTIAIGSNAKHIHLLSYHKQQILHKTTTSSSSSSSSSSREGEGIKLGHEFNNIHKGE